MMKGDCSPLPFKPKLLFNPVGDVPPLTAGEFFACWQAHIDMKKRLCILPDYGSLDVHIGKGLPDIQ